MTVQAKHRNLDRLQSSRKPKRFGVIRLATSRARRQKARRHGCAIGVRSMPHAKRVSWMPSESRRVTGLHASPGAIHANPIPQAVSGVLAVAIDRGTVRPNVKQGPTGSISFFHWLGIDDTFLKTLTFDELRGGKSVGLGHQSRKCSPLAKRALLDGYRLSCAPGLLARWVADILVSRKCSPFACIPKTLTLGKCRSHDLRHRAAAASNAAAKKGVHVPYIEWEQEDISLDPSCSSRGRASSCST